MKKSELQNKISSLEFKIKQISVYGGIVPQSMQNELVELKKEFDLKKEDQLEIEFEIEYKKHYKILKSKLEVAEQMMKEVIRYADDHGIQFSSKFREFDDTYSPESLREKCYQIDNIKLVEKVLRECDQYYAYGGGWQHSMRTC